MPQAAPKRLAKAESKARRRSPLKRFAFTLYVLLVILSALIVGVYIFWNLTVKAPDIPADPTPIDPAPSQSQPVGPAVSTPPEEVEPVAERERRPGVYTFALLGRDKESGNTDTIILLTYDTKEQKVGMVSVPRDTAVHRTWSKNPKINSAYASKGVDTLKQEIEQTFGIPIDFYIYIKLNGFIALVDQLGGVDVYIPENMDYDDPFQDLHIHYTKGQHHLNGQQAMEVVRFRDNNDGTGYTDVGRAEMQRQVLVAMAKKVLSWNSLTKVQDFVKIFQTYVKTDLFPSDMAYFVSQAVKFDMSGLTQRTLKGRGDGIYKGYKWCYIFNAEDILPTLNETVNPYDQDLTAEDLDLVVPDKYLFNY